MNKAWLWLILSAFILVSACMELDDKKDEFKDQDTLSVNFSHYRTIRIINPVGRIYCTGDTLATRWHAYLTRSVKTDDQEQAQLVMKRIRFNQSDRNDELTLEILMENDDKSIAACAFEFCIPCRMAVNLSTEVGDIILLHTRGETHLKSITGNIQAEGITADQIDIESVTGSIAADFAADSIPHWDIKLTTGAISCYIPKKVSAVVECRVTTGSIEARNLDLSDAEQSSSLLRWKNMQGEGTITLDLITGSISLTGY
ncbi:MAG: DUF4097 family beta strand repeat protein [Candidatus Delongbacteria bacterium]|nr:DUF4097 family beta strand repeat protein [Candidatus Delongbacteria bacterium]